MIPLLRGGHPRRLVATGLLVGALGLSGCSEAPADDPLIRSIPPPIATGLPTGSAGVDPGPQPGGTPRPEEPGPFGVGRRTEQVVDPEREGRALPVEVWYPSDARSEPTPYELAPGVRLVSALSTIGARPSAQGPFPVVVFSHGSGGLRQQSASIVETIASHGFVVVAPDHAGDTATDLLLGAATPPEVTATNRVRDVATLLDRLDSGRLAKRLVDTDKIAVIGHSFGGFTALASAGGFAGIPADPRVDAVVAFAPFSQLLTDQNLKAISSPLLVVTGSNDTSTPVQNQSTRPVNLSGGRSRLVTIDGAEHASLTDVCAIADALENGGELVPDEAADLIRSQTGNICTDPQALARAFDITEHYAVGFLRSVLLGDSRYDEVSPIKGATVQK